MKKLKLKRQAQRQKGRRKLFVCCVEKYFRIFTCNLLFAYSSMRIVIPYSWAHALHRL